MSQDETQQGGCLCGAVRFHFDRAAVVGSNHCHCRDCQRATGSAFATFCVVPDAAFELERGREVTITLDDISASSIVGSFEIAFGQGGITGTFDSAYCRNLR